MSLIKPAWFIKMNSKTIRPTVRISTIKVRIHALAIADGVQLNQWTPATLTCERSDAGVPEPEASVTV